MGFGVPEVWNVKNDRRRSTQLISNLLRRVNHRRLEFRQRFAETLHLPAGIMGRLRGVYAQLPWSRLPVVSMTSSSFRAAYARHYRSFAFVTQLHTTETFTRDLFEAFTSHLDNFRNKSSMGAAPFPAVIATKLAGNWRKDKSNSEVDCYARQLDLLQIQGIQKACALKLINGLQIDSDQERESLSLIYFHQRGAGSQYPGSAWVCFWGAVSMGQCLGSC